MCGYTYVRSVHEQLEYERVQEWLASLPSHAQLRWGSPQISATFPLASGWADLCLPQFTQADASWLLEVYPSQDVLDVAPSPFAVTMPYDVELRIVLNAQTSELVSAHLFDSQGNHHVIRPKHLQSVLEGAQVVLEDERVIMYERRMWSIAALQVALQSWLTQAGRSDLHLTCDLSIGQQSRETVLAELQEAGYYPLSNSLYLSPDVVEQLFAADPDRAIQFLDKLAEDGASSDIIEDGFEPGGSR